MSELERSVAVIGTGAIGGAVVRRLLAHGHDVVVWNRTASRTAELVEAGAWQAASPREAASSASLILLTLTDYAAVRQCLEKLDAGLAGRTIIVMCTGTPAEARQAAEQATALGAEYLDAGVQASPEMIAGGTATILYGGPRRVFQRHHEVLALLGEPRLAGDAPEAAAVWDLALFGAWYDAQLGLLRALDTAREAGIDVTAFAETVAAQLGHVVAAVPETAAELRRGDYPRGPADLTEHLPVVRGLVELRAGRHLGDGGLPAVAARIEQLIDAGRGAEGLTATIG